MARFDEARLDRIGAVGRRYVDEAKIPCSVVQVADASGPVYTDAYGWADVEDQAPITVDSIFRIYSMTKPITSIVLMQLFEEGALLLEDPVEKFLPEFANPTVMVGGNDVSPVTRPAARSITIRDLLSHCSGLTYGFLRQGPVDARYRAEGLGDINAPDYSLREGMKSLAKQPLLFDPGTAWNYSMSTDVCGAVIEAITGSTLAQAFAERVFDPLSMLNTGFSVPSTEAERFTSLYAPISGSMTRIDRAGSSAYLEPPVFLSGGGGLVSTLGDYQKFTSMLLAGGVGDGNRLIGRRTLEYMASNHLPGGRLLNELGQSVFAEVAMDGMGFGLGFSVVEDPAANGSLCSVGEFAWGGAASTAFWVDPVEEITAVFMTQLLPSSYYPLRRQLRAAVYQALL
ncbi:beta-lactamase family protein [Acidimicrobiales bacterium]|jgi:CubicO group peptidase (beta-lactamase class C family)|nr:beta-lactamase family protein [bacterium]MDC1390327.1 beta-lactamase family protein [Acidimicrobiales bacterium]